jgi:hypothetical protein
MKRLGYVLMALVLAIGLGGCELETKMDSSSVPDGLKVPNEKWLQASFYEMELAHEKGLMAARPEKPSEYLAPVPGNTSEKDGYFDTHYSQRYAYYRKAMEVYLLQTLRLDVYDKQVEDSGLSFIPMPESKRGEYQRLSVLELNHLYIQNSPHIERLGAKDIALLNRLYDENGQSGVVTQEALDLVARTYPELIRQYDALTEAPFPDGSLTRQDTISAWDPNSLVVVFLVPDRFDENGNSIPDDIPLMHQREDWLVAELPKMRKQMMEQVDVPVTLVTCKSYSHWDIVFDNEIRRGLRAYQPSPNRPAY